MKFRARKEGNRLEYQRELVAVYLKRFKEGDVFICEIRRPQKKSSDSQRRYYFGAMLPVFMDHLGYDRDEKLAFHNQLKCIYYNVKPDKNGFLIPPNVFTKGKRTTKEAADFMSWVQRKAAEMGCYIEDPS